jgi:hypothetical protein
VTVQDQIRLWELERNRIKTQEGMPGDLYESLLYSIWSLASPQGSCTPRSRPRPTTNTSSTTHDSWMSCCGKMLRSAVSSAVSRGM